MAIGIHVGRPFGDALLEDALLEDALLEDWGAVIARRQFHQVRRYDVGAANCPVRARSAPAFYALGAGLLGPGAPSGGTTAVNLALGRG
jgi:hypothetical protein